MRGRERDDPAQSVVFVYVMIGEIAHPVLHKKRDILSSQEKKNKNKIYQQVFMT